MESAERSLHHFRWGIVMGFTVLVGQFVLASSVSSATLSVDVGTTSYDDGTVCNATLYDGWYYSPYSGALLDDLTDFWLFSDAELTNGQALEVVSSTCLVMMNTLRLDRAGRNGPVADKYIYDIMCADECILSDSIRERAMAITGCTCLQLSTQPSDPTYHSPGDWCTANTGRIVCQIFGQCGRWDCRISDFMCPRYEYNKYDVPHRGKGDCSEAKRLWQPVTTFSLLACGYVALHISWWHLL